MTTATFDQDKDEFVIHTPCIKATKYWPGDVGNFSTHAIVFANLIINGNKYGVLPFLVQVREIETFKHMPGVKTGDIGPKLGWNHKQNGWATFDNVRIPRNQLLMKFVNVDREGTFSIQGDIRQMYSAMTDVRMLII